MDKQETLESLRAMISAVIYGLVIGDSLGVQSSLKKEIIIFLMI